MIIIHTRFTGTIEYRNFSSDKNNPKLKKDIFSIYSILHTHTRKYIIPEKIDPTEFIFSKTETHAEVCSSSTSYSSLFTCASRYWMRRVRSSQENTRSCFAAESCWTEKISRTNPCRGCRMKLGTTSRNSTSCPDFTDSFLLLSSSREIGTIGACNDVAVSRRYSVTFLRSFISYVTFFCKTSLSLRNY